MKRIGVLGGTFNPIHIGHLAIAEAARQKVTLDKVIFVPSNWPPHKATNRIVSPQYRYRMVRLAVANNPFFEVSDFELKKEGKSYTIETMRYFYEKFSRKTKLYFILGGDLLPQLKDWRYIEKILEITTFIVVNRPGQAHKIKGIPYRSVAMPGIDISSSYLRRKIGQGQDMKYFIPDEVIRYIKRNNLYTLDKRGA